MNSTNSLKLFLFEAEHTQARWLVLARHVTHAKQLAELPERFDGSVTELPLDEEAVLLRDRYEKGYTDGHSEGYDEGYEDAPDSED